jgi:hydrogenase-4 component F
VIFALLLLPSLVAATVAALVRPYRVAVGWTGALLSLVSLAGAVSLWGRVLETGALTLGRAEWLRADGLSTVLVLCVSFVTALAAWLGPGLSADAAYPPEARRRFQIFSSLFAFTMLAAVTTNNVAIMWVAIEATTITSAVLVPLTVTKASVEASWKYLLLGSVGIALAFIGTVLAYFDFVNLAGRQPAALNWTVLVSVASSLHPEVMRLAFLFLLVGYGTKAGLAPMHTWLPDAHSEAPAPLSAMMSGVLLAVAVYAIIRWRVVVNVALGTAFADHLLIALGVLSLAIAAFSLVAQKSFKRMLAYSSIEHTGLTCLGVALGPLGMFAALLHLVNHSVAKSAMFFLAGRVQHRFHTTDVGGVSGLLRVMPVTGGLFAAGMLAVIGLPPFGLFISEWALVRAGFAMGRPWLMGVVLLLLAVAFVGLLRHLNRMLYGAVTVGVGVGERERWPLLPLALCIAILAVLGLTLPSPLQRLLARAVESAR